MLELTTTILLLQQFQTMGTTTRTAVERGLEGDRGPLEEWRGCGWRGGAAAHRVTAATDALELGLDEGPNERSKREGKGRLLPAKIGEEEADRLPFSLPALQWGGEPAS